MCRTRRNSPKEMDSILDRIRKSLAQRGWIGTAKMCWVMLLAQILPAGRRREARRRQIDAEFDRQYGVDTGGVLRPKADKVVGENWALGGHYEAVEPASFADALNQVQLPLADFTFIDFGSGKGRTLLLASEFPFKRIIGVEFCPELNQVARENVLRHPASLAKREQIEIVDGDATQYDIPDDPLVIFLNNPFGAPVMSKVVERVAESFHRHPRRIVVIYFWPFFAEHWEKAGFLSRIPSTHAIFDTGPVTARESAPVHKDALSQRVLGCFAALLGDPEFAPAWLRFAQCVVEHA
jgi:SAM-dependent methyltransferase